MLQQQATTALLALSTEEGPVRTVILDNNAIPVLLRMAFSDSEKIQTSMLDCHDMMHFIVALLFAKIFKTVTFYVSLLDGLNQLSDRIVSHTDAV